MSLPQDGATIPPVRLSPGSPGSSREIADWLTQKPWDEVALPPEVKEVPTMLTLEERQLLYFLSHELYSSRGRIIDGGCFLGGSTLALATGLRDRAAPPTAQIASYDMFLVEPYTLEYYGDAFDSPRVGASFRSTFDRNVQRINSYVSVREGDIMHTGWSDEPIEILFVDISKWWDVNDLLLQQFFPALVPGGVLIQQDYFWAPTPWLQISMELLADCFTFVGRVACSAVYVLTAPQPASLRTICVERDISNPQQRELLEHAVARWTGEARGLLECSRAGFLGERVGASSGRAYLRNVVKRYGEFTNVALCAQDLDSLLVDEGPSWHADFLQRSLGLTTEV